MITGQVLEVEMAICNALFDLQLALVHKDDEQLGNIRDAQRRLIACLRVGDTPEPPMAVPDPCVAPAANETAIRGR